MRCTTLGRFLGSIAVLAFCGSMANAAPITLAKWTFETSVPAATDSATISGIVAEEGSGTAGGVHASATTDYSNPVGNGSSESFSSNEWAIGDYYQFQTDTLGQGGVKLSWAQTRSSTGPSDFDLQWSTDGTTFNTAMSYTVGTTSFSSVTFKPEVVFNADLSTIGALNNQSNVYFRLTATSAPTSSGGTNRVDDFSITVPEPASIALVLLAGASFFAICRRLGR